MLERLVKIVEKIPERWKILEGSTTAPKGYKWIYNGESLFSGKREKALLKEIKNVSTKS